jgi:hypothetical protein
MSLFFDVLSSINNPNQQGSVDQLGSVFNSVQQLASSQGMNTDQMSSLTCIIHEVTKRFVIPA